MSAGPIEPAEGTSEVEEAASDLAGWRLETRTEASIGIAMKNKVQLWTLCDEEKR